MHRHSCLAIPSFCQHICTPASRNPGLPVSNCVTFCRTTEPEQSQIQAATAWTASSPSDFQAAAQNQGSRKAGSRLCLHLWHWAETYLVSLLCVYTSIQMSHCLYRIAQNANGLFTASSGHTKLSNFAETISTTYNNLWDHISSLPMKASAQLAAPQAQNQSSKLRLTLKGMAHVPG